MLHILSARLTGYEKRAPYETLVPRDTMARNRPNLIISTARDVTKYRESREFISSRNKSERISPNECQIEGQRTLIGETMAASDWSAATHSGEQLTALQQLILSLPAEQ